MSAEQRHYSPPTLLVVDDTPDNLMLMTDLLKDRYRVKAANSGEKALRVLQGDALPDLILLDVMMPGLSGHEVAQQLKRDPRTRDIPIIFLTAMAATEDEIHGLELGAVDYITKLIERVTRQRMACAIGPRPVSAGRERHPGADGLAQTAGAGFGPADDRAVASGCAASGVLRFRSGAGVA